MAAMIGNMINMKYGRTDELESDEWGVALLANAGYDPRTMIGVMEVLAAASNGSRPPEFMSTHPSSATRIQELEEIDQVFRGCVVQPSKNMCFHQSYNYQLSLTQEYQPENTNA